MKMLRKKRKAGESLLNTSERYRIVITMWTTRTHADVLEKAYDFSWEDMAKDLLWSNRLCPQICAKAGVWTHGRDGHDTRQIELRR